jgi:uncharacterized delta-60 repeat protein
VTEVRNINTYTKKVFTTMTTILVPLLLVLTYSCTTEITFLDEHGGNNSKVLPLTITPGSGAVARGTPITIATATPGAIIYYYTEGVSPAEYNVDRKPTIDAAMTIYAVATLDGYARSDIASQTYTIATTQTQSLFVGGAFGKWAGYYPGIVNINRDGSVNTDVTYVTQPVDDGFTRKITGAKFFSDGSLLVYGKITVDATGKVAKPFLEKYDPNGALDLEFQTNIGAFIGNDETISDAAIFSNGCIGLVGRFRTFNSETYSGAVVLYNNGLINFGFNIRGVGAGAAERIDAIAVAPDDTYLLLGGATFQTWNGATFSSSKCNVIKVAFDGLRNADYLRSKGGPTACTVISHIMIDELGYSYITGDFISFGGDTCTALARVSPTTSDYDATFRTKQAGPNSKKLLGILTAPDGKLFAYGEFTEFDNIKNLSGLVKLNRTTGSVDVAFGLGGNDGAVTDMAIDQTTKMAYAVGAIKKIGGLGRQGIGAFNTVTGEVDTALNPTYGFDDAPIAIGLTPSGAISVVGAFTAYEQTQTNTLAKFGLPGGEFSSTFNDTIVNYAAFDSTVRALMCTNDGLIVGGAFSTIYPYFTKINASGVVDEGFAANGGPDSSVYAMASLPDGRILLGGAFTTYAGESRNYIAMVSPTGILDGSFDAGAVDSSVSAIAVQPDGKILMGGNFSFPNSYIARVDAAGALDPAFLGGGPDNGAVRAIAIQSDGGIIAAGDFTSYDTIPSNYLVRLTYDGQFDISFDLSAGGPDSLVYATAIQPDGKILIAGDFTSVSGEARNYIARLNTDGSVDTTFDPGTGANGSVYSLLINADGTIYIGGAFTKYDGELRRNLALLFADGSLAPSFMSSQQKGFDSTTYAIAACVVE